jgi:RHS repeat-associated protein
MAWRAETPCGAFGFGYCDWNGQLSAVTNANGLVAEYAYDVMDRVTNIAWRTTAGASLGGFAYEYDAAGRIVSRRHSLGDPSNPSQSSQKAYAYDVMDRLASDGGVAYTYDAAGNRMTKTENGETITYTLGVGDRLASWTGGAYTYDIAGCVTRMERDGGSPTLDLVWNGQYQLVSVSTNGVFAEGYAYDALGRRAATTTREGTTRHVYDEGWQVVADIDGQGNVLASYVWGEGIDRLLAVRIGGESYYPLTDVQGTVWGYVDSQNNIVARWQYDAWGNVVDESVSVPALAALRYRFQGREWSAATGLTNFRMRWYDSVTGRWLSKDPIGLGGGLNLYAFCNCTPLANRDVLGLVDMNLFPFGDDIRNYAERHNPDGVFSIGVHGDANGVYYRLPTGKYGRIPVRRLARMIRNDPRYRRQPVQLDSCNVGNGQYPQDLSNLLGVEVRAPTRYAWYDQTGMVGYFGMTSTRSMDFSDPGELRTFRPSVVNSFLIR